MKGFGFLAPFALLAGCGGASANGAEPPIKAAPAAVAAPLNRAVVGRYRLQGGPDVASALELMADGHFRYMLSAGAVDQQAAGRWTSDGRTVTLNTEPHPNPPVFTAGPVTRTQDPPVILVTNPRGGGIAGVDLRVGYANGAEVTGYTQDYGWHTPSDAPRGVGSPVWVEISLAMYGIAPHRFALDPAAGNHFAFTLVPNDFGIYDFRDARLDFDGHNLVIQGPGGIGVFAPDTQSASGE
jgi:hypothetical protein